MTAGSPFRTSTSPVSSKTSTWVPTPGYRDEVMAAAWARASVRHGPSQEGGSPCSTSRSVPCPHPGCRCGGRGWRAPRRAARGGPRRRRFARQACRRRSVSPGTASSPGRSTGTSMSVTRRPGSAQRDRDRPMTLTGTLSSRVMGRSSRSSARFATQTGQFDLLVARSDGTASQVLSAAPITMPKPSNGLPMEPPCS